MEQLKDCSTGDVITVSADGSIDDVIHLLKQHEIRHLPVEREGRPVGMVSAGDVLATVGGLVSDQRLSTRDATVPYAGPTIVEQIMTTGIVTLSPEDPIAAAARLMLDRKIAAVVLVANDKIAGIVTERDYLQRFCDDGTFVSDTCRQEVVADFMATELVTAAPNENVFALMRDMGKQMHHLPVVKDGKLVGILSDHDVRRAMAIDRIEQITEPEEHIRLMDHFDAGAIMKKDVETTTPTATLAEAAKQMIDYKIGALPVMEGHELAGIITETDILRACVNTLDEQ